MISDVDNFNSSRWMWDNKHCVNYDLCGKKLLTYSGSNMVRCECFYKKKFSSRIGRELFSPDFYQKKSILNKHIHDNIRLAGDLEEIKRHITGTLGPSTSLSSLYPLPILDVCTLVDVYLNQYPRWDSFVELYDERHMVIKVGFQKISNKKTHELLPGVLSLSTTHGVIRGSSCSIFSGSPP